MEAYRRLELDHYSHVEVPRGFGIGPFFPFGRYKHVKEVELADRTQIHSPLDLLPAVPAGSGSAVGLQRSDTLARTASQLQWGALAAALSGVAVLAVGQASESKTPYIATFGVLEIAALAALLVGNDHSRQASLELEHALESYDVALKEKLNLCDVADSVVACEDLPLASGEATPPTRGISAAAAGSTHANASLAAAQEEWRGTEAVAPHRTEADADELIPLEEHRSQDGAGPWLWDVRFHGLQLGLVLQAEELDSDPESDGGVFAGASVNYYLPVFGYSADFSVGLLPAAEILGEYKDASSDGTGVNVRADVSSGFMLRVPVALLARYGSHASRFSGTALSLGAGVGLQWAHAFGAAWPGQSRTLPLLRLEAGVYGWQLAYEQSLGSKTWKQADVPDAEYRFIALHLSYLLKSWK